MIFTHAISTNRPPLLPVPTDVDVALYQSWRTPAMPPLDRGRGTTAFRRFRLLSRPGWYYLNDPLSRISTSLCPRANSMLEIRP